METMTHIQHKVQHRFINHKTNIFAETLIVGTFNPDTEKNEADFFYGRSRNYLWRILATAFDEEDLKGKEKSIKLDFIKRQKIEFVDVISEVIVDEVSNYYDGYLDNKVSNWRDVISEIKKLKYIKRVCFTRISFSDIPQIHKKVEEIRLFCLENKIHFQYLTTPARFYNTDKQQEWNNFFLKC